MARADTKLPSPQTAAVGPGGAASSPNQPKMHYLLVWSRSITYWYGIDQGLEQTT